MKLSFYIPMMVCITALFFGAVTGKARAASFSLSNPAASMDDGNVSARSAAMGSAFAGAAEDASALFTNPALLAYQRREQVAANTHFWLVETFQEALLVGFPGPSHWGGFGLAGSYLGYGTFEGRDESGTLAPNYSASRLLLKAGWGMEFLPDFSLGLGTQGTQTTLADLSSWTFALDLGALWKVTKQFRVAAAYNNLGINPIPGAPGPDLRLGLAYEWALNASSRLLVEGGAARQSGAVDYLRAGLEYALWEQFFLRAGYQAPLNDNGIEGLTGLTAGAGIILGDLGFDYAYLPYGELGNSHRITLSYQFGTDPDRAKTKSNGALNRLPARNGPAGGAPVLVPPLGSTFLPGSSSVNGTFQAPLSFSGTGETSKVLTPGSDAKGLPGEAAAASATPATGFPVVPTGQPVREENPPGDKDALDLEFDMPSNSTLQGKVLEKQGRYREAGVLYQQSIKDDKQDTAAWLALGNLYYRFRQKEAAVRCFESVVQLESDNKKLADWLEKYKAGQP